MASERQCPDKSSELTPVGEVGERLGVPSSESRTRAQDERTRGKWRQNASRSQEAGCTRRSLQQRFSWRQKQVIAVHALCLLLAILPAGLCQNSTSATTSTAPTTTTAATLNEAKPETTRSIPEEPNVISATTTTTATLEPTSTPAASDESHSEAIQSAPNATQQPKLKPVNFTLVDELFETTLADDELARKWRNMDAQFQEGIRNILKLVFPQIVAISQDAKVSGHCSGGILKWILSLRNLRSWAIKMLDATGKPTSGIFEGSLTMFGNYRQCLSIRAPDEDEIEITDQFEEYFRGQFCVLHMRPWLGHKRPFYHLNSSVDSLVRKNYKYYEKTLYDELAEIAIAFNFIDIRMDLCVPSTCTVSDIQRVADLLSRKLEMRAKVMRCDIEPRESGLMQNIDLVTIYWLILPLTLLTLTLLASLLATLALPERPRVGPTGARTRFVQLIHLLSIQNAAKNLLSKASVQCGENKGAPLTARMLNKPLPLYGLRNFFVLWFVIVQLTIELNYQYLRDSLVLRNMMLNYWPLQVIINTTVIFESLILITAFTFSYCNLESGMRALVRYIVQKYVRLVPNIVTLIMITVITPTIAMTSPVWKNFVERQSQVCKSTGYLNLFFLQNFISFDKICLPHTWLLCVEFQLMVLTLPLVLLLKRTFIHHEDSIIIGVQDNELAKVEGKRKDCGFMTNLMNLLCKSKAGLIGLLLVLIGSATNFALVYTQQLPPAWFNTFPDAEQKSFYFSKYLTKAWTHLSAFVVGLYAGHVCRATIQLAQGGANSNQASNQINGHVESTTCHRLQKNQSDCVHSVMKVAAFGCLLAIVFSTFNWSTSELPTPLIAALFDSLSRLVWSLALVGLMVKLCLPSGPLGTYLGLSRVLAHQISQVLGRLSLCAYLVAPYVHTLILALQEQSLFPSLYLIFHVMVGNIVIIYLVALLLIILIELPIRLTLCQLIWRQSESIGQRANGTNGHVSQISSPISTTTTSAASLAG